MRSIFILIDALGWNKVCETGFLPELSGTRVGLKAVLGYSGGCQAALFSGRTPAETGRWLMYYFTRNSRTFSAARRLRFLPRRVKDRGRFRRWLRSRVDPMIRGYYSLYHVPMEALPFLDLSEKEDLYAPGGLAPARGILDDLEDGRVPYSVWSWRTPEADSLRELMDQMGRDEKRFYLLYWTKLDALMHEHGTRAREVDVHLRGYEEAIRRILDASSRLDGETRLFIFSDHGMIDTVGTIDLMGPVNRLGLRYGKDYVAFYDSTLARFSFFSKRARSEVGRILSAEEGGEVLDRESLESLGVYFPDARYGECVFLTDPGVIIEPSYMGDRAPAAMHGFHPDAPGSDAHLLSTVDVGRPMESVMDLYDVMRGELER